MQILKIDQRQRSKGEFKFDACRSATVTRYHASVPVSASDDGC